LGSWLLNAFLLLKEELTAVVAKALLFFLNLEHYKFFALFAEDNSTNYTSFFHVPTLPISLNIKEFFFLFKFVEYSYTLSYFKPSEFTYYSNYFYSLHLLRSMAIYTKLSITYFLDLLFNINSHFKVSAFSKSFDLNQKNNIFIKNY
jgi:hypothetical protein